MRLKGDSVIPLSPIDYYFFRPSHYTIQFVFEYSTRLDPAELQASIQKISEAFTPARHRLEQVSEHELILRDQREHLSLTVSENSTELDATRPMTLLSMIDPVTNKVGNPLTKFKLTRTPTRSYLGVSFSHILGDGYSFMMFMAAFAQVCRGEEITLRPANNRQLLCPPPLLPTRRSVEHLYAETGYSVHVDDREEFGTSETVEFGTDKLEELKQDAAALGEKVTDNDVIMASLFKTFAKRLPLTEAGTLAVRCPVDYRRTYPGLSPAYFGNAVKDAVVEVKPEQLEAITFSDLVKAIRGAINGITPESVGRTLSCLDQLRQQEGLSIFAKVGCPGLLVTNLSRLPFQTLNLGSGSPSQFYVATFPRRVAIITRSNDGLRVNVTI